MLPVMKENRVIKYVILKIGLEPAPDMDPDLDAEAITHDLLRSIRCFTTKNKRPLFYRPKYDQGLSALT